MYAWFLMVANIKMFGYFDEQRVPLMGFNREFNIVFQF